MPQLIDLSQEIYQGMPLYPGHLSTVMWDYHTHEGTAGVLDSDLSYATRGLILSDHGPTHIDSLSHFDASPDAPTIDRMPLDTFWGDAVCLDVGPAGAREDIGAQRLDRALDEAGIELRAGDILLLRTGHYATHGGTPQYPTEYPGLGADVADWLLARGVKCFGVDAPSPDNPASRIYPIHLMCREHSITHYENLGELAPVAGRRFTFFGLPLRIRDGHGSPVRAVALVEG